MPASDDVNVRHLFHIHLSDGTADSTISIDHVYMDTPQACDECDDERRDPGLVGLAVFNKENGSEVASVLLDAGEALVLANRLERAAELVLQMAEDPEKAERELSRYAQMGES